MTLRIWVISLMVLVAASLLLSRVVPPVQADGDAGNIIFKDTKRFAPVVFSHQNHKAAGVTCSDCHDVLFKKKKGSTDANNALTMKSLRKGKFCGACHDGSRAFSVRKSCKKCHNSK
ncbi:MAG: cytochrome c3 family protein [Nitrospinae bacterium]|nr:cytochrome c3 family protein [Nitrospinota bacterium]